MKFRNILLHFWKSLVVGSMIVFLCLIPSATLPKLDYFELSYSDLISHTVMFLVFSVILYLELNAYYPHAHRIIKPWAMCLIICLFLGISTEMLQFVLVTLNRTANIYDFIFDGIGTVAGILGMRLIKHKSGPVA